MHGGSENLRFSKASSAIDSKKIYIFLDLCKTFRKGLVHKTRTGRYLLVGSGRCVGELPLTLAHYS